MTQTLVGADGFHRWDDMRDTGLLWAINRHLLHPQGFALAITQPMPPTDDATGWRLDGNGQEVWRFGEDVPEDALMARWHAFLDRHRGSAL